MKINDQVRLPDYQHEIEVYKGQTIIYDENLDKFICDMSSEDLYKKTSRRSLKDVKKEIDQFIKINIDFKPFKFLVAEYGNLIVKEATALRTDKKLNVITIGERGYGSGSHWGKRQFEREGPFYVYDQKALDEMKKIKELEDRYEEEIMQMKNKVIATLKKGIDISKYDLE